MLLAFALIASLSFAENNYFIREDYKPRTYIKPHDDRNLKDGYQNDIYQFASTLYDNMNGKSVFDIGCGSGFKLMKYFSGAETVGAEIEPTLNYLKKKYPSRMWIKGNFFKPPPSTYFDIIICADVIEHIQNPDDLLNWISNVNFKYLILSTPDRDKLVHAKVYKVSPTGPPKNKSHYREWNSSELKKYIEQYFFVLRHEKKVNHYGQMIVATKK